jgi:ABC-type glycerol-3-phosphate transport system substrate-binding protein
MRKILVFLVLIGLMLGACAAPATEEPAAEEPATEQPAAEEPATEAAAEPVEVVFWHSLTGAFGEVLHQLIDDYNASQDAVIVIGVYQGNYQDTQVALLAELAAGGSPDLAQLESSFSATMVANGSLQSMQSFIDDPDVGLSQDVVDAIFSGFRQVSSFDGVMYTMPFNMSMPVLYYNATMLQENGLEPPETWDDFLSACAAVTSGDQFGFTINPGNVWIFEAMVMQNGGQLFNEDYTEVLFNSPEAVGALDFWAETAKQGCGKMQPWEEGRTEFFNGNVAFYKDSSGGLSGVKDSIVADFELGVTHIPWGQEQLVTIGGGTVAIFANSPEEVQLAAWDFVKFMTSPESVSRLSADTGYLPTSALASDLEPLKSLLEEDTQRASMLESLPFLVPRPNVAGYAEIQSYLREAIEAATLLQATSQEALDTAAGDAQQVLDGQ